MNHTQESQQTTTEHIGIESQTTDLASLAHLVDEEILQQMIEDTCADIIPVLIDHYVEETEKRLGNLSDAISNHDADKLEFEAHTLGSSALALGNRSLSVLSRKIEKLCQQGDSEQAFVAVEELHSLADASIKAILARKEIGFESKV